MITGMALGWIAPTSALASVVRKAKKVACDGALGRLAGACPVYPDASEESERAILG
jgi:hypothetical protein